MRYLARYGKRLLALTFGCVFMGVPSPVDAWQGPGEFDQSGGEVLTQGPVHEAFAEPVVFDPIASPLIPKEPPPPVEELPPDQRPEGQDVQWISGYWAWDDSRGDFLWISGIWRDIPPGRQWVPGYWSQAQEGFQWVPGTWALLDQGEAEYLPAPPQSLEMGPNSPAPSADVTWAPGCWYYQEERYIWRPGYWVPVQEDWLWVPAHYVWSPYGYLFVEGYWDRPIVQRGLVFAPVYFAQPVYRQPNFVFAPTIGIVATALISNLFVRPSYNQYYFGDYYAPNYTQAGIVPWYQFHQSRRGYDPIYSYYASVNRNNPGWGNELRQQYDYRRDHVDARPPRTFVQQNIVERQRVNIRQKNVTNVTTINNIITNNNVEIGRPIGQIAANPRGGQRYERLNEVRRKEIQTLQVTQREFRERRASLESRPIQARSPGESRPRRVEWARSPIASQAREDSGRGGPPPRPAASRLDPAARPQGPGQARRRGNPDLDRVPDGPQPGRPNGPGPDQPRPGLGAAGQPERDRANRPGLDRPGRPGGPGQDQPRPGLGGAGQPSRPAGLPEAPKAAPRPDRPRPGRPDADRNPNRPMPNLSGLQAPGEPGPRPDRLNAARRLERPTSLPSTLRSPEGERMRRPGRPGLSADGSRQMRPGRNPEGTPPGDSPIPARERPGQFRSGALGQTNEPNPGPSRPDPERNPNRSRPNLPGSRAPGQRGQAEASADRPPAGLRPERSRPSRGMQMAGPLSIAQPNSPAYVPPSDRPDRTRPGRSRNQDSPPRALATPMPVPPGAGQEVPKAQDQPGEKQARPRRPGRPGRPGERDGD